MKQRGLERAAGTRDARKCGAAACPHARAAICLLEQGIEVIRRLDDRVYAASSATIAGGTIGKHFRHALDHFNAALAPVRDPGTLIDYDRRERHVLMETCRRTAACEMLALVDELALVGPGAGQAWVSVRVMVTSGGHEETVASTLARELAFACHHAVHHHAMIKAIAREFGFATPGEFGVAPSTLNFQRGASR